MKKIILLCVLLLASFVTIWTFAESNCVYDGSDSVGSALEGCIKDTNLVGTNKWINLELKGTWFKDVINNWIKTISWILALAAVWGIAYWSFLMVISQWEEEKFSSGKKIIIWSLAWFLALVTASTLIAVVVNLVYWL